MTTITDINEKLDSIHLEVVPVLKSAVTSMLADHEKGELDIAMETSQRLIDGVAITKKFILAAGDEVSRDLIEIPLADARPNLDVLRRLNDTLIVLQELDLNLRIEQDAIRIDQAAKDKKIEDPVKAEKTAQQYFGSYKKDFETAHAIISINRYSSNDKFGLHILLDAERRRGFPMDRVVGLFSQTVSDRIIMLAQEHTGKFGASKTWDQLSQEQQQTLLSSSVMPMEWKGEGVMDREGMAARLVFHYTVEPETAPTSDFEAVLAPVLA